MRQKTLAAAVLSVTLLAAGQGVAGPISVINGSHDVVGGTVTGDLGLDGLGYAATLFADSPTGWSDALASGNDTLIIEQDADASAPAGDIKTFINNGGRVIELGDFESGPPNLTNQLFGTTIAYGPGGFGNSTLTGAAAGTSFADDPAALVRLSSTHPVASGSLPTGSTVFYESDNPISGASVFRTVHGAGDYFYFGWDFCCAGTADQRNDWYAALDSAIAFDRGPSAPVPAPSALSMLLIALGSLAVMGGRRFRRA